MRILLGALLVERHYLVFLLDVVGDDVRGLSRPNFCNATRSRNECHGGSLAHCDLVVNVKVALGMKLIEL